MLWMKGKEWGRLSRLDLHVHTTASDGMFSPVEVVRMAKAKGLQGIAVTDHDTVAGVEEARACGQESGLVVIPGVEISTVANGQDIHVLGYFVDPADEQFQERLREQREARKDGTTSFWTNSRNWESRSRWRKWRPGNRTKSISVVRTLLRYWWKRASFRTWMKLLQSI